MRLIGLRWRCVFLRLAFGNLIFKSGLLNRLLGIIIRGKPTVLTICFIDKLSFLVDLETKVVSQTLVSGIVELLLIASFVVLISEVMD